MSCKLSIAASIFPVWYPVAAETVPLTVTVYLFAPVKVSTINVDADDRRVNGDKAKQMLGYHYIYDDLNHWL